LKSLYRWIDFPSTTQESISDYIYNEHFHLHFLDAYYSYIYFLHFLPHIEHATKRRELSESERIFFFHFVENSVKNRYGNVTTISSCCMYACVCVVWFYRFGLFAECFVISDMTDLVLGRERTMSLCDHIIVWHFIICAKQINRNVVAWSVKVWKFNRRNWYLRENSIHRFVFFFFVFFAVLIRVLRGAKLLL
jgi:hypothetical protein